ncbi:SixA phosphatase family protein [Thermodesulforhabdus norvegica]|uniref:Phosphohistidine phosphatase, SixA n=1 Tax=Thermodesulforhabdus norvegica TaxID=39841 RepID=A0A1I4R838_9BACT|nr:histidine phosphatase family protein [Thermodesulforhabdus norvegica]SFM48464.1 phosphohistidine phosphatase, SixA [Thermodesulforhabdus norvegica]
MLWYLVQHGRALPEDVDPERSLSSEGIKEVGAAARGLKLLGIKPHAIFSSTKKRSIQTAELIASILNFPNEQVVKSDVFRPSGSPEEISKFLKEYSKPAQSILIAGHMPGLQYLADALIGGSNTVAFVNAGVLCIESEGIAFGTGRVLWYIRPEQFELMKD